MSIRRVVVSSLGVIALLWALILPGGAQQAGIYPNSGTAFPTGMPTSMQGKFLFIVTDDSATGACDSAAGSAVTLCRWISGATWTAVGDGTGAGLGTNLSSSTNDILSNTGTLRLGATGGTNNETLDVNCETTANKCTIASASGVTEVDTGTIALKTATLTTAPADDPTDSYIPATAGETAWYTGVNNDSVGDDNDCYEVRRSATPGTSVDLTVCSGAVTGPITATNLVAASSVVADAEVDNNITVTTQTNTKSTAYTINTDNAREAYGGVIYVSGAAIMTLPVIASGMSVTVITIGAVAVSVDPNGSEAMYLDGTLLGAGIKATNPSTTGSLLVCTYHSAATWYCASGSNNGALWTNGGA